MSDLSNLVHLEYGKFLAWSAGWKTKVLAIALGAANAWDALAPQLDMTQLIGNSTHRAIFNVLMVYAIWWARNQSQDQ